MANLLSQSPIIIDTANASIGTATIFIAKVRWVGASGAGQLASISNAAGDIVWSSVASGANYVEIDTYPIPATLRCNGGFGVPTLGSGKLYLYIM